MKISDIVKKLESRIQSKNTNLTEYKACASAMLRKLQISDPNTIIQWGGDCTHTGDHYPIDKDGDIHFDKKRFFKEGEPFPDDDYTWIPTP